MHSNPRIQSQVVQKCYKRLSRFAEKILFAFGTREDLARLGRRVDRALGIGSGASGGNSGEISVISLLNESDTTGRLIVFDVGANQGQYSSLLSRSLPNNVEYEVHCFEPSPDAFHLLEEKELDKRFQLNNFGLSRERGMATLFSDKSASGLASLTHRQLDHFEIEHGAIQTQVQIETLDEYCGSNRIGKIDTSR